MRLNNRTTFLLFALVGIILCILPLIGIFIKDTINRKDTNNIYDRDINSETMINAVILKIDTDKPTAFYLSDNKCFIVGDLYEKKEGKSVAQKTLLVRFLQKGDSIVKNKGSNSIFIYRKELCTEFTPVPYVENGNSSAKIYGVIFFILGIIFTIFTVHICLQYDAKIKNKKNV